VATTQWEGEVGEWLTYAPMVVTVPCLLLVLLALLVSVYLLFSQTRRESRIRRQALHDYRAARGTQHFQQLRASLSILKSSLKTRKATVDGLEKQLNTLRHNRSAELKAALSKHLVDERLTEVPGIGQRLAGTIVRNCFRGDLRDLRFATRVDGVGDSRQQAVMAWVRAREAEFPRLLAGSFPKKQDILSKYTEQERSSQAVLESERATLESENQLFEKGYAVASKLRKVKVSHFRKALRRNLKKSPVPAWYFIGVYPPWEPMPEWFETLLGKYGG
jgi:DNA-binding helix-hairpin-helix protein with protein kinase domain